MPEEASLNILAICSRPLLDKGGQPIPMLDVAEERRRIEDGIRRAGNVARAYFLPEATTGEVNAALGDRWDVVHFTGHGTADGRLVLEDGLGVAHLLTKQETAQLFTGHGTPLVVLSSCYSETVARELHAAGVPAVVAVDARVPIADLAAIIFAQHFYTALARGSDVQRAFDSAQSAVALDAKVGDPKPPRDESGNVGEAWSKRFKLIGDARDFGGARAGASVAAALASPQVLSNLREVSANFVGRAREIVKVVKTFDEADARRVAICGSGGLGKTELAKAVGRWYAERARVGAVLWSSAAINESEYKLRDLASLLNIAARAFGLPITEQTMFDEQKRVVREFLADRRALVILDNWEAIEKGQHRSELWDFAKSLPETVRVLVTSRDVLPPQDARNLEPEPLLLDDATELFVKIARNTGYLANNPRRIAEESGTLYSICERLSGYPLAVEVVAGQTFSRTLGEIWDELQHYPKNVLESIDENTGEPRGVWTSLDLSYNVLSPEEQSLFRQMCVFLAPAAAEDIAAITATENPQPLLTTLVKRSLVRRREGAYTLLPVLRDYAEGKLADTGQDLRELHGQAVNHYGQKNTIEDALTASDHLFELAARFELRDAAEAFAGYVPSFYHDLVTRGYWTEARSKTEQLIAVARALGDKQTEARAIGELGSRYQEIGEYGRARELYRKALSLVEESEDKRIVAGILHQQAILAQDQGDYGEAARLYQQSLEIKKELGDKSGIAGSLHQQAMLAQYRGDYGAAARLYQQSLKIEEELGNKSGIATSLHQLGNVQYLQGNHSEAARLYQQSLEIKKELGDKSGIADSLHQLGMLAQDQGDYGEAARLYQQSLEIKKELGNKSGIAGSLHQQAILAQDRGDYGAAARLYQQSLKIEEELGNKSGIALSLGQLGQLSRAQGQIQEAFRYFLRAFVIFEELHSPYRQLALGDIESVRDAVGEAQFAAWLKELSPDAERINDLLEQKEADAEQRTKEFIEQLVGVAQAVVGARKQGSAEEQAALAQRLVEMEADTREQGMAEVADFIAVLRGLLAGEDVAGKIAALVEPFKGITEQARAACE